LIEISFKENLNVEAYTLKVKEDRFLIIESSDFLLFSEFKKLCFSTINSLAFISGKFIQNEGIFFAYKDKELNLFEHFHYTELRDSINAFYYPICGKPYRINRLDSSSAKAFEKTKVLHLTQKQFNNLCNKSLNSLKFSSIILLIIESSIGSLLSMPSGFSVALEGITELICAENEDKIKPIKERSLAKKIRKEMLAIIDKYKDEIKDEDGLKILEIRVNNLNSPTNQSKLIKPFKLLGIKLNENDIEAIKRRNNFLHGDLNLGVDTFEDKETKIVNKEVYSISLRLFTLLSALILKHIGYEGNILNHPKIYEKYLELDLEEGFYRKI
jgi:hypothetical protein